jgi:hypothetical protein
MALALTTLPPRTAWLQPGTSFSCSGERLAGADLGAGRREETPSLWPCSPCALYSGRLCLLPLTETAIVGSVVAPAAAAFELLL